LFEDYDFHTLIKREDFESLSEYLYDEFKACLNLLLKDLNIELHSVEIIGGTTRMPYLQQIIINEVKM